jgi:hypothetical protein
MLGDVREGERRRRVSVRLIEFSVALGGLSCCSAMVTRMTDPPSPVTYRGIFMIVAFVLVASLSVVLASSWRAGGRRLSGDTQLFLLVGVSYYPGSILALLFLYVRA